MKKRICLLNLMFIPVLLFSYTTSGEWKGWNNMFCSSFRGREELVLESEIVHIDHYGEYNLIKDEYTVTADEATIMILFLDASLPGLHEGPGGRTENYKTYLDDKLVFKSSKVLDNENEYTGVTMPMSFSVPEGKHVIRIEYKQCYKWPEFMFIRDSMWNWNYSENYYTELWLKNCMREDRLGFSTNTKGTLVENNVFMSNESCRFDSAGLYKYGDTVKE